MIRSRWKFWLGLQHWCISSVFQPVSSVHLPQGTSQFPHLSDLYPLWPVPAPTAIEPFQFQWPITEPHQSLSHNIDCSCSMRGTSLSPAGDSVRLLLKPEVIVTVNPFWNTSSSTSKNHFKNTCQNETTVPPCFLCLPPSSTKSFTFCD